MILTLTERIAFYESVFGSGVIARNSKNFAVRCPICDPKDHSKKKLAILVEESCCHCWTCGFRSRTLAPLIRKYGTQEQLAIYRERFMSEDAARAFLASEVVEDKRPVLPKDFRLLAMLPNARDPDVNAVKRYLISRDISERDLWFYRIGVSDESTWRRRVIIPSLDANGQLNYYTGRAVDKYYRRRYENPDAKREQLIFNEINIDWSQRLVLCEGPFDMMKCGDNAVPLLGSDLNEDTLLLNTIIANNTPVALALDADMRLKKTPRIAKKLAEYDIDVVVVPVPDDPGKMSKAEFKHALAEAKPLTWVDTFQERLAAACNVSLRLRSSG